MVEAKIANVKNKVSYLKALLETVKNGVNETSFKKFSEFKDELEDMKLFFEEDKFFIESVRLNKRNLKEKFKGDDLQRALDFLRGEKVKRHLEKKCEEAIGFREIAKGNFENFSIVAYRREVVIRGESLKEKTNFKNFFFKLTTNNGFKEVKNEYRQAIINAAKKIIEEIKKTDTYKDSIIELVDAEEGTKLPLEITCIQ